MMDTKQQLMEIYRQHPCRTLPNALWKTIADSTDLRVDIQRETDHLLTSLAVWQGSRLMAFWCENNHNHSLSSAQVAEIPFALVHSAALPIFENRQFSHQEAFFRFIHQGEPQNNNCPPGFTFRDADPRKEIRTIAKFVRTCYLNINMDESIVRGWLNRPVYEPNLWVWIIDETTDQPAALGVAELDHQVPEASLEWIQVLPAYRGRGLGKAVVAELLRRASDEAEFTTVAGKINNPTRPDRLYQRCGFTGRDLWWLLTS